MYIPVNSRATSAYRQVGVQSVVDGATPHMLIKMLFDGLMQCLNEARGAIQRGEVEEKGRLLGKAVRIIDEGLKGALNPAEGGQLAENLGSLYSYCIQRLTLANLRSDAQMVQEVASLIEPVAQGWAEIAGGAAGTGSAK